MSDYKRYHQGLGRGPAAGRSGFTLIELLVALAIGSIVMLGIVQMFKSNRIAFTLMDQMRVMEENARIAVDFIARDFRGISIPAGAAPIKPIDNDDGNYATAQGALVAKDGTDIIEIFKSTCANPISIPSFNENASAAPQIPRVALVGCMPCYVFGISGPDLAACVEQYDIAIVDVDGGSTPVGYTCENHMTSGNWQGADRINLGWNNGVNTDQANRPHQCNNPNHPDNQWDAMATIGQDIYYYVSNIDTDNPRLVRYVPGGAAEVIANYVEDFQVQYGVDGIAGQPSDGVINTDEWVNGDAIPDADGDGFADTEDATMIKVELIIRTLNIDPNKEAETAPTLANSGVAFAADKYRRRIISRTVRLRNTF